MRHVGYNYQEEIEEGRDLGGADTPPEPSNQQAADNESLQSQSQEVERPDPQAEGSEPKTMLEAIERELAKKKGEKESGEQSQQEATNQKPDADKGKEENADDALQMPDGLSPKAQERFKNLVAKIKERDSAYQELESKYREASTYVSQVTDAIRSVGASPDQLQVMMQYLKAYNSGDLQTRKNLILAELRDISMKLGEPVDNFASEADPLNIYPDLKQAVESFQIGREQALEMARLRTAEYVRQQQERAQYESQRGYAEAVQKWKQEADNATAVISKMTAEMAKTDPAYPQIEAVLMQGDALKEIVQNFPPNTWVSQVKLLISNLKRAMPTEPRSGEPRPLSGGSGKPQGTAKPPASMYEAMFGQR